MPDTKNKHIVVLGAGITGLQTALALLEAGYSDVTILAEHFPGDDAATYTSPQAGGQWRSHAHAGDEEQQGWEEETYRAWLELIRKGKGGEAGLGITPSTLYWSSPEDDHNIWWSDIVEDFKLLLPSELPSGVHSGVHYSTICINVPKHLQWLLSHFKAASGCTVKTRLVTKVDFAESLRSALSSVDEYLPGKAKADVFVNATGIGARELAGDDSVYPVKGQTVLVKGESRFAVTSDENRYVIPRPGSGTTILGGTRDVGVWETDVSEETTRAILDGCKSLAPELLDENGDFKVLSVQSGLRPGRQGGPRVESELVGEKWPVIHSYGHAGAGYQLAIGSARKVVRLLEELLE